jgi:methylated-DNA-[protein]-cysteine S-methyltransferase
MEDAVPRARRSKPPGSSENARVGLTYVRYAADGWGLGELVLDGDRVLHSSLPRPRAGGAEGGHRLVARLQRYFAGESVDFADVEVELGEETSFGRALAEQLRRIPRGEVVSYGELALLAGRPRAARVAGQFCARCSLAPILPVHRVVSVGGLGGFGSLGPDYKRRLLELEGAAVR